MGEDVEPRGREYSLNDELLPQESDVQDRRIPFSTHNGVTLNVELSLQARDGAAYPDGVHTKSVSHVG
ncbi:MAG: hypothetical protein Q4G43_10545 [Mobilicoccus sp.]|nr:hypothetical protein [Mobilicoccus sp.]